MNGVNIFYRNKFSVCADAVFYAFCALAVCFCALRYYRIAIAVSAIVSLCLSLAVGAGAFALLYLKTNKKALSKAEREEKEKLLFHLALEEPEKIRADLYAAYLADGKEAERNEEQLFVGGERVEFLFQIEPISADDVARLIRRYAAFRLVCNEVSEQAKNLLLSFSLPYDNGTEVYALFKRTNTMPTPLICGNLPRKTAKQRLKRTFSKQNARPFLISGALLLIMSLFVLFPLYYLITGSVLLFLAVFVRIFGYSS